MVYLSPYPVWLQESHKLLTARPETAKISSKYRFPAPGKATFILKTYDPVSGTCLKYKTDKGAEVGRLVSSLGGLGKRSLGLEVEEDLILIGAGEEIREGTESSSAQILPSQDASKSTKSQKVAAAEKSDSKVKSGTPPVTGGQQGGKKKKKGKK